MGDSESHLELERLFQSLTQPEAGTGASDLSIMMTSASGSQPEFSISQWSGLDFDWDMDLTFQEYPEPGSGLLPLPWMQPQTLNQLSLPTNPRSLVVSHNSE